MFQFFEINKQKIFKNRTTQDIQNGTTQNIQNEIIQK
jgi:hypothetical protein